MRFLHTLIFVLFCVAAQLQITAATPADERTSSDDSREKFLRELRDYKHLFMARELALSREQQNKFFPLYDRMEDECDRVADETRDLERRVAESDPDKVSSIEYQKAAEALFELKIKEGEIEKEYLREFASILSPRQLFQLKAAERTFSKQLMEQQFRLRGKSSKK